MKLGTLDFKLVSDATDLVAEPVLSIITSTGLSGVYVAEIDPALSDTAAFCERYGVGMDISANCVVIEAKRADTVWYGACVILATMRADINGIVRKHFDARKTSFAPMSTATSMTEMEFGGITPIGLPSNWPILVDRNVAKTDQIIIGSGIRKSKLLVPGALLETLPNTVVMGITKAL